MAIASLSSPSSTHSAFQLFCKGTSPEEAGEELSTHFTVNFSEKKEKRSSRQQQILTAASKAIEAVDDKYSARRSLEARKAAHAMITEGVQSTVETSEEALDEIQEETEARAEETREKRQEERAAAERVSEESVLESTPGPDAEAITGDGDSSPIGAPLSTMPPVAGPQSSIPHLHPAGTSLETAPYTSLGENSLETMPSGNVVDTLV